MPLPKLRADLPGRRDLWSALVSGLSDSSGLALDADHQTSGLLNLQDEDPATKYAPYPPFNAAAEVYMYEVYFKIRPYWRVQVQVGNPRVAGSTRVDFLSDLYRIAFHPDGEYYHPLDDPHDALIRAGLAARGYLNVVFRYSDLEDAMERFLTFASENLP